MFTFTKYLKLKIKDLFSLELQNSNKSNSLTTVWVKPVKALELSLMLIEYMLVFSKSAVSKGEGMV